MYLWYINKTKTIYLKVMANLLDEVTGPVNNSGRDVHVIDRQLPVEIGFGSTLFQIALWVVIPILVLLYVLVMGSTLQNPLLVGDRKSVV